MGKPWRLAASILFVLAMAPPAHAQAFVEGHIDAQCEMTFSTWPNPNPVQEIPCVGLAVGSAEGVLDGAPFSWHTARCTSSFPACIPLTVGDFIATVTHMETCLGGVPAIGFMFGDIRVSGIDILPLNLNDDWLADYTITWGLPSLAAEGFVILENVRFSAHSSSAGFGAGSATLTGTQIPGICPNGPPFHAFITWSLDFVIFP